MISIQLKRRFFRKQNLNFLIFFLFTSSCSLCQKKNSSYIDFYRNVNEGDFYFVNKEYKTAACYYKRALKFKVNHRNNLFYKYAISLYHSNSKRKALKILKKGPYSIKLTSDSIFFIGLSQKKKSKIVSKSEKIKKKNKIELDAAYFTTFEKFYKRDQEIRNLSNASYHQFSHDSLKLASIKDSLRILDSLNLGMIDSLIHKFGFKDGTFYPDYPDYFARTFLLHIGEKWMKENEDFLIKQITQGQLNPYTFASAFDRILFDKSEFEYYGKYQKKLDTIQATEYFNRLNSIGLSPYFLTQNILQFDLQKIPKSLFYTHYREKKKLYNCTYIQND